MKPSFTLKDLEARCKDSRELLRGRDLLELKAVLVDVDTDAKVSASVRSSGKEPYVVVLCDDLTGECDCPAYAMSKDRKWCKHLVATSLSFLLATDIKDIKLMDTTDLELIVGRLSPQECAALLVEAAVMSAEVRRRLTEGTWLSAIVALGIFLVSCQPADPVSLQQQPGRDGGSTVISEPNPQGQNVDGSRLKVQWGVTLFADGTKVLSASPTIFDTQLHIPCYAQPAEDGKQRCLPAASVSPTGLFSDNLCTNPAYYYSCNQAPPVYLMGFIGSCPQKSASLIYKVGSMVDAKDLYDLNTDGSCKKTSSTFFASYGIVARGDKVDPTQFVAVTAN